MISRKTRIAVIGAGKIGEAIIRILLKKGFKNIVATCKTSFRKNYLEKLPIKVTLNNREAAAESELIIISVKPHQVESVLKDIKDVVDDKLIISVAAGIPTSFYEERLKGARIIRAMPNINILTGYSATAICKGEHASKEDLRIAEEFFKYMGYVAIVEERLIDPITAYSGSGPAFVLEFFEAFVLAGLKVGIPRDLALNLAINTMVGTAKLLENDGRHPAELRDMVITPGGVTIEGIHVLEKNGFKAMIIEAVEKTYEKSSKLLKT
ncbi:MAG: pyrroline-5-carboxylate reductase [Thermoprotei archaeon]|nr:MAG: pyrroline-5-carboxylate reductase [Thermoprotei archaeon]